MADRAPQKVTAIYVWIATDADGGEGVPAITMMLGGARHFVPMLGADRERMESLRPKAEEIRRLTGRPMRLVRFSGAPETLDTLP